ncbi:Uncharacterised protein [Mycobacterium tuberculosis]|uniref:Uncharacterized protein n=1 Tax=Mycobacterium tuberculosis TaxID=1773 RepID=A0A654U8H4_MYCTX|nr:Uncharacterised protein [Mycobacterium tuberculosis]
MGLHVSTITCPSAPMVSKTSPILASRSGSVNPSASSISTGTASSLATSAAPANRARMPSCSLAPPDKHS